MWVIWTLLHVDFCQIHFTIAAFFSTLECFFVIFFFLFYLFWVFINIVFFIHFLKQFKSESFPSIIINIVVVFIHFFRQNRRLANFTFGKVNQARNILLENALGGLFLRIDWNWLLLEFFLVLKESILSSWLVNNLMNLLLNWRVGHLLYFIIQMILVHHLLLLILINILSEILHAKGVYNRGRLIEHRCHLALVQKLL